MPADAPRDFKRIDQYAQLEKYMRAFAAGLLRFVLLIGPAGVQKSRMAHDAVGEDACLLKGHATAYGMYEALYEFRDEPVVIDDLDNLYRDAEAVRLLKCLCDTEPRRRVSWHSQATTSARATAPPFFYTTSSVLLISNDWKTVTRHVGALEDRAHTLLFEPTALEVHLRTATWFRNQEVLDFVGNHLHLIDRPSMRDYVRADELQKAGFDWRADLLERWGLCGARLLVAGLKADASFATEEDRALAFVAQGGGCRATYFNHARKLAPPVPLPTIALASEAAGPLAAHAPGLVNGREGPRPKNSLDFLTRKDGNPAEFAQAAPR
jgi:hypothetical protein